LPATVKYTYSTRRAHWRFHTDAGLRPGHYLVLARAVDQSGNVETRYTRRNRKAFRVESAR
jgi:hypothetical protein